MTHWELSDEERDVLSSMYEEGATFTGVHEVYEDALIDLLFAEAEGTGELLCVLSGMRCVRFNRYALTFFGLSGEDELEQIQASKFFPCGTENTYVDAWGRSWECEVEVQYLSRSKQLVLRRIKPLRECFSEPRRLSGRA